MATPAARVRHTPRWSFYGASAGRTYPGGYGNNERYAAFLEEVLTVRLAGVPVIVPHDRGNLHAGEPLDGLDSDMEQRVGFEPLPPTRRSSTRWRNCGTG